MSLDEPFKIVLMTPPTFVHLIYLAVLVSDLGRI